MTNYTDLEDLEIKVSKNQLMSIAMNLMEKSINPEIFATEFQVKPNPGTSMFETLVNTGKASNVFEAAVLIGKKFKPSPNSTWNDLARWVAEYESYSTAA